jgi:hypothetical protein
MKSIIVDIKEDEFDEMGIQTNHLSLNELEDKLLVHRIRKNISKMHEIVLESEGQFPDESEIFAMVKEIKNNLR